MTGIWDSLTIFLAPKVREDHDSGFAILSTQLVVWKAQAGSVLHLPLSFSGSPLSWHLQYAGVSTTAAHLHQWPLLDYFQRLQPCHIVPSLSLSLLPPSILRFSL